MTTSDMFAAVLGAIARHGRAFIGDAQALLVGRDDPAAHAWRAFLEQNASRLDTPAMLLTLGLERVARDPVGAEARAWLALGLPHPAYLRRRGLDVESSASFVLAPKPDDRPGNAGALTLAVDRAGRRSLHADHDNVYCGSLDEPRSLRHFGAGDSFPVVAVSDDGAQGALGGKRGAPIRFDLATGARTELAAAHREGIAGIALLPSLVTLGRGGELVFWRGDEPAVVVRAHDVAGLALAAGGGVVWSLGSDRRLCAWSSSGEALASLPAAGLRVAACPDGSVLTDGSALSGATRIVVWRDVTGKVRMEIPLDPANAIDRDRDHAELRAIAIDPDARVIAVAAAWLELWDAREGRLLARVDGKRYVGYAETRVSSLALAGGRLLETSTSLSYLRVWDVARMVERGTAWATPDLGDLRVEPSGRWAVAEGYGRGPYVIDLRDESAHVLPETRDAPMGFAGSCLWARTKSHALVLWDLDSRTRRWSIEGRLPPELLNEPDAPWAPRESLGVALDDGRHLALVARADAGEAIDVLDLEHGRVVASLGAITRVRWMVAVPGTGAVVWASADALGSGSAAGEAWRIAAKGVGRVAVDAARGRVAAVVGAAVELYRLDTGAHLGRLRGRTRKPNRSVAVLPDGNIVVVDTRGKVVCWDFETRAVRWTAEPQEPIFHVRAHPDGRVVFAAIAYGHGCLLDANTGSVLTWTRGLHPADWPAFAGVDYFTAGAYSTHDAPTMDVVPFTSEEPLARYRLAYNEAANACATPDGGVIVVQIAQGRPGRVRVFDLVRARV